MKTSLFDDFEKFKTRAPESPVSVESSPGEDNIFDDFEEFKKNRELPYLAKTEVGRDLSRLGSLAGNLANGSYLENAKNVAGEVGEDISNIYKAAKEGIKMIPEGSKAAYNNKAQALAGIIPSVTSLADIPALIANFQQYAGNKAKDILIGKSPIPPEYIDMYGHELGSEIANLLVGKPKNEEQKLARTTGEIALSTLNPINVAKTTARGIAKGVSKIPHIGEGVVDTIGNLTTIRPKSRAERNLIKNIGEDLQQGLENKKIANELGFNVSPYEATGNPILEVNEAKAGTTKKGALALHKANKIKIREQKEILDKVLDEIAPKSKNVNRDTRKLAKELIKDQIALREKEAAPIYEEAFRHEVDAKDLSRLYKEHPIIKRISNEIFGKGKLHEEFAEEIKNFSPNSIKVLDLVKQEIDDIIGSSKRLGNDKRAMRLSKINNQLKETMDKFSPVYKKARSIYSTESEFVNALKDSIIGDIAKTKNKDLKNIPKRIFDLAETDLDTLAQYKGKVAKKSPETWRSLIRQHMENELSKKPVTGHSFFKKILEDERAFKQYDSALSEIPSAQKKLRGLKRTLEYIKNPKAANKLASQSEKNITEFGTTAPGIALRFFDDLLRGRYDKANVDLIMGNQWDKVLLKHLGNPNKTLQNIYDIFSKEGLVPKAGVAIEENREEVPKIEKAQGDKLIKDAASPALSKLMSRKDTPKDLEGFNKVLYGE